MSTVTTKGVMTAEEFFDWVNRPENAGRRWELENGEVVEMSSPGEQHSYVCWFIQTLLTDYIRARHSGHLLPNDCGLIVRRRPDTVRGPDAMVFLENRVLSQAVPGHVDRVPTLVVEVYSPSDRPGRLGRRVSQYLHRGIEMVWVVYPEDRTVDIYRPGQPVQSLEESDEMQIEDVLPGFKCKVSDLFVLPDLPMNPLNAHNSEQ